MTFDEWFVALYVKRGFVSSKAELQEAWEASREYVSKRCKDCVCSKDCVREGMSRSIAAQIEAGGVTPFKD